MHSMPLYMYSASATKVAWRARDVCVCVCVAARHKSRNCIYLDDLHLHIVGGK